MGSIGSLDHLFIPLPFLPPILFCCPDDDDPSTTDHSQSTEEERYNIITGRWSMMTIELSV